MSRGILKRSITELGFHTRDTRAAGNKWIVAFLWSEIGPFQVGKFHSDKTVLKVFFNSSLAPSIHLHDSAMTISCHLTQRSVKKQKYVAPLLLNRWIQTAVPRFPVGPKWLSNGQGRQILTATVSRNPSSLDGITIESGKRRAYDFPMLGKYGSDSVQRKP